MAITRMTAEQIAAGGQVDRTRLDATTEAEIRRHMIEDGEDPDAEPRFERPVLPQELRRKLGLSQTGFASLVGIPVATLRNWEQNRFAMEPAAQTLLKLIDREPEAALRAPCGDHRPPDGCQAAVFKNGGFKFRSEHLRLAHSLRRPARLTDS